VVSLPDTFFHYKEKNDFFISLFFYLFPLVEEKRLPNRNVLPFSGKTLPPRPRGPETPGKTIFIIKILGVPWCLRVLVANFLF
jgi:hypothetical protein